MSFWALMVWSMTKLAAYISQPMVFANAERRCGAYSGGYRWTTTYGFVCWALGLWPEFGRHRGFGSRI